MILSEGGFRDEKGKLVKYCNRLRRNRTPPGKVHELKARETSQEPLALGQMLEKNRRPGFSFCLSLFFFNFGVRGRDFGAERPAVEISYFLI